jgi:MFS family permease
MSSEAAPSHRKRDLRAMLADGVAFSLMVGIGETYIAAFALALGMGEVAAGLISSLPLLAGAVLQLASPWAVRRLGSHRRWVVLCALVQATSFVPMVAGALAGRLPPALLYMAATIYWGAGMATGPAWNYWAGTLVPRSMRAGFFARRSRFAQAAVLAGVVGGGLALQFGAASDRLMHAFALLFLAAGCSRYISASLLASQSEPHPMPESHRLVRMPEMLRRAWHAGDGRLLAYMVFVQVTIQVAGPYYTPFMLEQVRFSYAEYLTLIGSSFAAKMLTFLFAGSLIGSWGPRRVLIVSGMGIVPFSAMWIVSTSFWYLLAVQVAAGVVWAGWELATFLLMFETIHEEERTSVLTTFNLGHAAATVTGALCGAAMLASIGREPRTYALIFGLSSLLRLVSVLLLVRLRERPIEPAPVPIATRVLAVRQDSGSVDVPITPSIPSNGDPARRT